MLHPRFAPLPLLAFVLAFGPAVRAQSVTSTHSGLLYFFDGYVFIDDQQVQQKFGRFPEIGQGHVLRTDLGRAEILLTPGVFLRVNEHSSVKMVSDSLAGTKVELLTGSAILEAGHEAENPPDTLIYKGWTVRLPKDSVSRIDSEPAQIRVLSGTADVKATDGSGDVTVQRGELLPLGSVLVADQAAVPVEDSFNTWAMNRSSIVSEDNSIAKGITDDPDQFDQSGAAAGNFSYFPATGIPSLGITYPYGMSFWSPYQAAYASYYPIYPTGVYPYPYGMYGVAYPRLYGGPTYFNPSQLRTPTWTGTGVRPLGTLPARPVAPAPRVPTMAVPHMAAPHAVGRR